MPNGNTFYINLYDLLICLTDAGDLVSPEIANHHQQVAYLALRLAEQMGLPAQNRKELTLAGLLHDIGAISLNERLELIENEPPTSQNHAFRGAKLLEGFQPLRKVADIIRHHHIPWQNGEGRRFGADNVSDLSHILHLADRIAVSVDRRCNSLGQVKRIQEKIKAQSGGVFMPEVVEAFLELSGQEYIWLDLTYKPVLNILPQIIASEVLQLNIKQVIDLTRIFSSIIDLRSSFTATHSAGVAATAEKLAELMGFSKKERQMMLIAGYLHDLGKLAVDNAILEKPGRLEDREFHAIKTHTYYTYRLLQTIKGFETITVWASYHHEKLNGTGYPFHVSGDNLPLGSRIMAVADVFAAITEDRPYRKSMPDDQAVSVLNSMVKNGSICGNVVDILLRNFDQMNEIRRKAQKNAAEME